MNEGLLSFITLLLLGIYLIFCGTNTPQIYDPIVIIMPGGVTDTSDRPSCVKWHKVRKGDTQWGIANRYDDHDNHWQWIKSMRWVSRKSEGDEDIKTGESVCVVWRTLS